MENKRKKIECPACGGGSFRYSLRETASYCLKCGHQISKADIEKILEGGGVQDGT